MSAASQQPVLGRAAAVARMLPETAWVAIAVALAQLPILDRTIVTLDEGQVVEIGHRLASGEALYRDVHTGIFPGLYWLAELLLRVFGTDVLVLRWAQLGVNTLIAVLLFALVRPLVPARTAWLAPLGYWMLVVLSFPVFTMLSYSPLSLLAALAALVFCRRYVSGARVADGVATGALLGLSVLVKQNFGGLALVAVLVSALWTRGQGRLAKVPILRAFAVPVLAGTAVGALAVARLVASGAWSAFLDATLMNIAGSQMGAFNQPLPPVFGAHPDGGMFYFLYGPGGLFGAMFQGDPLANTRTISAMVRLGYGSAYLALALAPVLAWRLGGDRRQEVRLTVRIVVPFAVLFFAGIFPFAIWSHLAVVYPPLLVVLVAGCSLAVAALERRVALAARIARRAGTTAFVVLALLTARLEFGIRRAHAEPLLLPSASVHVASREARLYRAADDFLRQCAAEGEPVFVAPYMPLLYVTSGHPNPTPYDLLVASDVSDDVAVAKLRAAPVRCAVFNARMYPQLPPFEETFPKLAAYLSSEFEQVGKAKAGDEEWKFLRRRAPVSPGAAP